MSHAPTGVYEFEDYRLDVGEQTLVKDGNAIAVTPKVFETLVVFLNNPGRLVQKNELMESLWPDRFVEEGNLTFHVGMLRKALGDDSANPRFIETVPRRGYRFIAPVTVTAAVNGRGDLGTSESATSPPDAGDNGKPVDEDEHGVRDTPAAPLSGRRPTSLRLSPVYLAASAIVAVIVAGGLYFWLSQRSQYERLAAAGILTVEPMSETGNTSSVAVSSDGKLMAYHTDEGQRSTLWLRQNSTGNTVPLLVLNDEFFSSNGFSSDGAYIYYTHQRKGEPLALSRIPTLGGLPTRLITDLHSGWSFSPDEKAIAFTRFDAEGSRILIANSDGGNEREVFFSSKPRFIYSLSWSPDGTSIAYSLGPATHDRSGVGAGIFRLKLADGATEPINDIDWASVGYLSWLEDQSGLLFSARAKADPMEQVWIVSYPGGKASKLTNDSRAVAIRGATSDLSRILAVQKILDTKVWVAPAEDPSAAAPLASAEFGVAWTRDNKLVFSARSFSTSDLWIVDRQGGGKRQLTSSEALDRSPTVPDSGSFIAYISTENGQQNVWRMNPSGGDKRRLSSGDGESYPVVTPDEKWVLFTAVKTGALWKVPADGGEAVEVCSDSIVRAAISPDGKFIAHFGRNKENKRKLLVRNFSDCGVVREFEAALVTAYSPKIIWAADGKSLVFALDDAAFTGNLWRQPLDGQPVQKVTSFTSEQLYDFSISPDGKWIAYIRGEWQFDAVLLKGLD